MRKKLQKSRQEVLGPGGRSCHGNAKRRNFERNNPQDLMMDWRMGVSERKESKTTREVPTSRCAGHVLNGEDWKKGQFEGMKMKRFVLGLILRCILDNSSRDVT